MKHRILIWNESRGKNVQLYLPLHENWNINKCYFHFIKPTASGGEREQHTHIHTYTHDPTCKNILGESEKSGVITAPSSVSQDLANPEDRRRLNTIHTRVPAHHPFLWAHAVGDGFLIKEKMNYTLTQWTLRAEKEPAPTPKQPCSCITMGAAEEEEFRGCEFKIKNFPSSRCTKPPIVVPGKIMRM